VYSAYTLTELFKPCHEIQKLLDLFSLQDNKDSKVQNHEMYYAYAMKHANARHLSCKTIQIIQHLRVVPDTAAGAE